MATLLIRSPDGSKSEESFSGELTVGRADGNGLVLAEGGVSRRHVRFFEQDGKLLVEDLGSANGTWVDGARIEGPTVVGPRAQIVVGDYELSVRADAPSPSRRPPPRVQNPVAAQTGKGSSARTVERASVRPARATRQLASVNRKGSAADRAGDEADRARGPGAGAALARRPVPSKAAAQVITGPTLKGITGPWANRLYPIRDMVVVGRVAGVEIQLEDESVSRRHAELQRTAEGVMVRDLNSANGTRVNGAPLEGELLLQPGDIVQFGMIELSYEAGDEDALAAPSRRTGGRAGSGSRRGLSEEDPATLRRKKLVIFASAIVGVLLVAGIVVKSLGGGDASSVSRASQAPSDPKAQLQSLLSECRSQASMDFGRVPDWEKAERSCNKALDLDPINGEAIKLIKKIRVEQEASKAFAEGEHLMGRLREQEALDQFAKIPKESDYYPRVKPRMHEAIAAAKKKSGEECQRYAKGGNWAQALKPCERYMLMACQNMTEEELYPPLGSDIELSGPLGPRSWRPKDAMYFNFLRAREKQDPQAGPWACPTIEMYQSDIVVVDHKADVKRVLKERFPDQRMFNAMMRYWDGSTSSAVTELQRVQESQDKVELHAEARDLQRDIASVESLMESGAILLRDRSFDRAAEKFQEALRLDEKLMKALATSHPSFVRKNIERDVAEMTYAGGKELADRGDHRRACVTWKLGYSFNKGSADLNRALQHCSTTGADALAKARTCDELVVVLDFHLGHDGLDKRVAQKRAEWKCP